MNPSRLFILRPVATALTMVAILLAGLVAYRHLSVSALPQVDYPIIQVATFYPGASPSVMASSVTAPRTGTPSPASISSTSMSGSPTAGFGSSTGATGSERSQPTTGSPAR